MVTSSGGNIGSLQGRQGAGDLSGPRAEAKHGQGIRVTSGEAGITGRREGKTEASSEVSGGVAFAEDTAKREN